MKRREGARITVDCRFSTEPAFRTERADNRMHRRLSAFLAHSRRRTYQIGGRWPRKKLPMPRFLQEKKRKKWKFTD